MITPLGTTVSPDSVMVKPRALSCSGSKPTRAPSSTTTFLSIMARSICAWRPTYTSSINTDRETEDQEFNFTPGDKTEPVTVAPDTITPGETIESAACPRRPGPRSEERRVGEEWGVGEG